MLCVAIMAALLSCVKAVAEPWNPVEIDGIYYNLPSSPAGKAMVIAPYGHVYSGDLTLPSSISHGGQSYQVDGLLYVFAAADISSLTLSEGFTGINLSVQNAARLERVILPSTTAANSAISCGLGSHRLVNVYIRTADGKTTLTLDRFGICGSDGIPLRAYLAAGPGAPARNFDADGSITFDSDDAESYGCVRQADSYVINLYCDIEGRRIRVRTQSSPNHSGLAVSADGISYMVTGEGAAVVMNREKPYTGHIGIAPSVEYGGKTYDVTIIDDNAFNSFYGSDISSVDLPQTLRSIGYGSFSNAENLEGIVIPDGVSSIGSFAFYGCRAMTYAEIPDGLTYLGRKAFHGCTSLNAVELPAGTAVHGAFDGSPGLCRAEVLAADNTSVRLEVSSNIYLKGGADIPLCVYTLRSAPDNDSPVLDKIYYPKDGIVEIPAADLFGTAARSDSDDARIYVYCDNTANELFPPIAPGDTEPYSFASFDITKPEVSAIAAPSPAVEDAETEYYSLSGLRLHGRPSAPGIYISRSTAGSSKIIIH